MVVRTFLKIPYQKYQDCWREDSTDSEDFIDTDDESDDFV